MTALLLTWFACARPEVGVREALDVPPPPGQLALDLGPIAGLDPEVGPGDTVTVEGVVVDVVDRRDGDGGAVLTVYADEERAAAWVLAGTVRW